MLLLLLLLVLRGQSIECRGGDRVACFTRNRNDKSAGERARLGFMERTDFVCVETFFATRVDSYSENADSRRFQLWRISLFCFARHVSGKKVVTVMARVRPCNVGWRVLPSKVVSDTPFLSCLWTDLAKILVHF